jgi:hypothetical protein
MSESLGAIKSEWLGGFIGICSMEDELAALG